MARFGQAWVNILVGMSVLAALLLLFNSDWWFGLIYRNVYLGWFDGFIMGVLQVGGALFLGLYATFAFFWLLVYGPRES